MKQQNFRQTERRARYEILIEGENSIIRTTQRDFIVQFRAPRKSGLCGLARHLAKEVANLLIQIINYDARHFIY